MTVHTRFWTLMRRGVFAAVSVFGVSVIAASCGNDTLGVATTVVNVTPTNFATIPPVASTLPGTTTSLPANAVGTEQIYVVKAGDSPLAVANKYSISLTALLAYNGDKNSAPGCVATTRSVNAHTWRWHNSAGWPCQ